MRWLARAPVRALVRALVTTRPGLRLVNILHRALTPVARRRFFHLCFDESWRAALRVAETMTTNRGQIPTDVYSTLASHWDAGQIIEMNEPNEFFSNPQHERTKLFLSQILH